MKKKDDVQWTPVTAAIKRKFDAQYGNTCRISRHDYSIVWCKRIVWHNGECAGLHDPTNRLVYVIADDDAASTLVHEMAHGEFCASGLRQTTFWTRDLEEQVVELMSQMISHSFTLKKK